MGRTFKYNDKKSLSDDLEYKIFKQQATLGKREKKETQTKEKTEKRKRLQFDIVR